MAPVDRIDHNGLEQQLKDVVQDLYQIMVQVSSYDSAGRASKDVLSNEIKNLSRALGALHTKASPPNILPAVPPELLEYVENGRNPDIYTREFVELVRRGNQLMRGKMHAFGSFRDILAADMASVFPELREDVIKVCEATGGKAPSGLGSGDQAAGAGATTTAATSGEAAGMPSTTSTSGGPAQEREAGGNQTATGT